MRQLTIQRPLDPGNPPEAQIIQEPSLAYRTLQNNIAPKRQTMLLLYQGAPRALRLVEKLVDDPPFYVERAEVVRKTRDGLLVLQVERTGHAYVDIAGLSLKHLGPETLTSMEKSIGGSSWSFLTFRDAGIQRFLAAVTLVEAAYAKSTGRDLPRYSTRSFVRASALAPDPADLTPIEAAVLAKARAMGHYERPRRCKIADVAHALRMPPSTAHYHLTSAVRKLIEATGPTRMKP